ncbi:MULTISPECIES: hydrolase [Corallincola]|uniref:Hydrolase n=2 Tax=Corallincola TaxID=1775176 RepID=A0ABY1WQQ2_9GAMM|nr:MULTISPECIES: hydrolase [Corallincola]TAA46894.1 hydrolase [Corallincola spongiicola]TCI04542.1 hydrolase [Corallincola luteus]
MIAPFNPPWWLKNPHLQTILPTLLRRKKLVNTWRERWELEDGDFIDLDWLSRTTASKQPIVVLLHGLEGSVNSPYAQGMLQAIKHQGWQGVLMHFRGCSGEPNRLPRAYHSGEIGDISALIDKLQLAHPDSPLLAVGYSLGANVLIRYQGEKGKSSPLCAACAISPPLDLAACADRIGQGLSRIYQRHLLTRMRKNVQRKLTNSKLRAQMELNQQQIAELRTFWQFDQHITAPLHGFSGVDDYYQRMSGLRFITQIKRPTLLIHAADDPFMTSAVIPKQQQLPPSLQYELYANGGHVGFLDGGLPWRPSYWLERRVPQFFHSQLETQ